MMPKTVRLPFGFRVSVRVVSARQVKRANGRAAHGCWDAERHVIYVDKALGEREQRYVLTHELIHALADWQHFALGGETDPTKAAQGARR